MNTTFNSLWTQSLQFLPEMPTDYNTRESLKPLIFKVFKEILTVSDCSKEDLDIRVGKVYDQGYRNGYNDGLHDIVDIVSKLEKQEPPQS